MEWNKQQLEVLDAKEKKILVLAGAGSGKTAVLKEKVKRLVERGVSKKDILAISFTNEATEEMKERVEKEIGKGVTFSTFHKLGKRMLEAAQSQMKESDINRRIIDQEEKENFLKAKILEYRKENTEEEKREKEKAIRKEIKLVTMAINYALANNIKVEELTEKSLKEEQIEALQRATGNNNEIKIMFIKTYVDYLDYMERNRLMDISQMITRPIEIAKNEKAKEIMVSMYKYVFVDEFQDANDKQQELMNIVSENAELLFVVGDDYQAIYRFQGSNIKNILNFKKNHPTVKEIKLETNYRSSNIIVEASNSLIKHNKSQTHKNMRGVNNYESSKITVMKSKNKKEEYRKVAKEIKKLKNEGKELSEIAVLYRSNNERKGLIEAMDREGLLEGESKDFGFKDEYYDAVMNYLEFMNDKNNYELYKKIAIFSRKGLGEKTLERLEEKIDKEDMLDSLKKLIAGTNLSTHYKIKAYKYLKRLHKLIEMKNEPTKDILEEISDILCEDRESNFAKSVAVEVIISLQLESRKYKSTKEFIKRVNEKLNRKEKDDKITLQTVHASKGKEYNIVFIIGANESNFPLSYAKTEEDIAEERRLFYVGMTRAKKKLYISYALENEKIKDNDGNNRKFEKSRFLEEIDSKYQLAN